MAENQVAKLMRTLGISEAEAKEVMAYDAAVEKAGAKTQLEFDLDPEKSKQAKKFANAGVRKTPTVYKFDKPKVRPNPTKEGIISEIQRFLSQICELSIENCQISNPTRQISFEMGGKSYDLTLVEHRKK